MKERATPMKEQDLTLVGLTEDKQRLVLVNAAGEEFTLPADARLRAALRGDHARLGQLEITMDIALRPRDIQARIRAGESPEHVAAAAQTTLDKVMGYATPVLAERAHVADRAQKASVRRKAGEGPARPLADAVAERLLARNVDPATVEWDAWRRDDGRWTLVADYRSGESARHAEFVFDAPGRYVVADDDEARWLVGEQTAVKGPAAPHHPRPAPALRGEQRRRAAAGRGRHRDGDRGPRRAAGRSPSSRRGPTEDLSATAAAVRATGDADWIATERPTAPTCPPSPSRSSWAARPTSRRQPADEPAEERPRHAAPRRRRAGPRCRPGTRSCSAESGTESRLLDREITVQ